MFVHQRARRPRRRICPRTALEERVDNLDGVVRKLVQIGRQPGYRCQFLLTLDHIDPVSVTV